jgi:hypothetical protein
VEVADPVRLLAGALAFGFVACDRGENQLAAADAGRDLLQDRPLGRRCPLLVAADDDQRA